MNAPLIARMLGVLFLLAAIAGFLPFVTTPAAFDAQVVTLDRGYVLIGNLFPVNWAHDAVHAIFGIWGLAASFRFAQAVAFNRAVVWIYGLFVLLGLIPITNTLFGIAPIYGHDIWLHALFVIVAAWGAYGRGSKEIVTPA